MVLREVSDRGFVSPDHFAGVEEGSVVAAGFAKFGFRRGGRVREQRVYESGLPYPVAAHESDPFAARDAGGEVTNYPLVTVRFAQVLDLENVFAGRTLLLKLDV